MLKAENLSKSYGNKQVVKNVSFNVQEGEVVGLLGPNGAGKTTSFYMIVGLIKANNGKVLLNDNNIETYHTNPFLHAEPNYHIYIPKEASPESRCCRCDPLLLGMSLMLAFVLVIVCVVIIIVNN